MIPLLFGLILSKILSASPFGGTAHLRANEYHPQHFQEMNGIHYYFIERVFGLLRKKEKTALRERRAVSGTVPVTPVSREPKCRKTFEFQGFPGHSRVLQRGRNWGCVFLPFGRALEWHSRGQRFDPAYLHQKGTKKLAFERKQAFFLKKVKSNFRGGKKAMYAPL